MTPFGDKRSWPPYIRVNEIKRALRYRITGWIRELQLFTKFATHTMKCGITGHRT